MNDAWIIERLQQGRIGVIASDTLFGLIGRALDIKVVDLVYRVKKRDTHKPCIILIHDMSDLDIFHITLSPRFRKFLERIWPGPVTVILRLEPEYVEQFAYLHRGTGELTFRLPQHPRLQKIIASVGPLVAPSANTQGGTPAISLDQVTHYFGDSVDSYVEENEQPAGLEASTIIKIKDHKIHVIREGSVPISLLEDVWTSLLVDDYSGVPNEEYHA